MKRADIKRRPLADTTLAGLEAESKEYRELDGSGLYFRVKPDGGKSWQLRYKRPAGNWVRIPRHPATQPTNIRPPIPRSSGRAVGAQRRRFALLV